MLGVPNHTCKNCGKCCGYVPVSDEERILIEDYIKDFSNELIIELSKPKKDRGTCQFRNETTKRCEIYPVRPMMCKLFGISGNFGRNEMNCHYGNSYALPINTVIDLIKPELPRKLMKNYFKGVGSNA